MAITSLDKENIDRLMKSLSITDLDASQKKDIMTFNTTTYGKLEMLFQQMYSLQKSAEQLIENAQLNKTLHQAQCNFIKVRGQVYHFYEREDNILYCSLISPTEWSTYFKFYGSFLFDYDSEFKKVS